MLKLPAVALALVLCLAACAETPTSVPASTTRGKQRVYGGGLAGERISDDAWAKATRLAESSTVLVLNHGCSFSASGSAVAVGPKTLITNRHVVDGARKLTIVTKSGRVSPVANWQISRVDDLAVLTLTDPQFDDPLYLAPAAPISGDLVVVMGYPLGGPFKAGRGRIVAVSPRSSANKTRLQVSVDVLPGNSGGPLLDTSGRLVGIVRAIDLETGSALGIPGNRVQRLLDGGASVLPGRPCDTGTPPG